MLSKNVNNKKCAPKLIFFNEKKIEKDSDNFWYRKLTLKVGRLGDFALFDTFPLVQFSKFKNFLWVCCYIVVHKLFSIRLEIWKELGWKVLLKHILLICRYIFWVWLDYRFMVMLLNLTSLWTIRGGLWQQWRLHRPPPMWKRQLLWFIFIWFWLLLWSNAL